MKYFDGRVSVKCGGRCRGGASEGDTVPHLDHCGLSYETLDVTEMQPRVPPLPPPHPEILSHLSWLHDLSELLLVECCCG